MRATASTLLTHDGSVTLGSDPVDGRLPKTATRSVRTRRAASTPMRVERH